MSDLQAEGLESLAADLKGKTVALAVADVTDLAATRTAVAQLEAQVGPTDLLLASTSEQTNPAEPAPSLFAFLHRRIVQLSHLLRHVHTPAEIGGLLLSYLGWHPSFMGQKQVLESVIPRPFLTARHPLPQKWSPALLRTLRGHTKAVTCCAVSPDGQWIVSASNDCTLKVWDAATGAERLILRGHTDIVTGCAVSPDRLWIVSASADKTLKVWAGQTGLCMLTFPVDGALSGCAFYLDGEYLVATSNLGIYFLQLVM